MKKGLLICIGGYSTSLIANKLNEASQKKVEFNALAMGGGTGEWQDLALEASIIMLSPQAKHLRNEIKEFCENKNIVFYQIDRSLYTPTQASKIWDEVKELI